MDGLLLFNPALSLQECEALGVSPPALPQLDEVSAGLAAMPVASHQTLTLCQTPVLTCPCRNVKRWVCPLPPSPSLMRCLLTWQPFQ
jgi:hypothetical protein